MAITKEYSQDKTECKVTFLLTKKFVNNFKTVCVLGDFNNWSPDETIFSESETDGSFTAHIFLPTNNTYQFRYLGDGVQWFNESEADREVESYFKGFKNSEIDV